MKGGIWRARGTDKGERIPELQKPYILMFAEFLKRNNVNPLEVEFTIPSGRKATVFKASDGGYNWEIK